ncbi:hypothetical protein SCA04_10920 [Staphylococcus carnosus]|nr:hypothetical protein SCA04_10920 [Staphylococcus carnosus]GEP78397.1 hypothetical protein SCA05_01900 [Staphylococcus carnosus]
MNAFFLIKKTDFAFTSKIGKYVTLCITITSVFTGIYKRGYENDQYYKNEIVGGCLIWY